MFGPRTPIEPVRSALREYCDKTALAVLGRIIECGAHSPDLIISADQKQHYLDLWASMAFEAGVRVRTGKTQRIFIAAQRAELEGDPQQAQLQEITRAMFERTKDLPMQSAANVEEILGLAFGHGAFDYSKITGVMPGVELASCIRFADFLALRVRI